MFIFIKYINMFKAKIKRGEIMRSRNIARAGTILLVLAFIIGVVSATENVTGNETSTVNVIGTPTETFTPNVTATETPATVPEDEEGSGEDLIGPGNALYGLKIAFGNIGEVFTFNASEKLGKQVSSARHRIAEARAALRRNDTDAANIALAEYDTKMKDMNKTMSGLSDNDTGFINAKMMILKHQRVLENLSIAHPDNKGLQRAYNNSRELQVKFESKTEKKPDFNTANGNLETANDEKKEIAPKDTNPEKGTKRESQS